MILRLRSTDGRDLASNRFVINIFDGELRQNTEDAPLIFNGSGSIAQDADGGIEIKLLHRYADRVDEWRREGLLTQAGSGAAGTVKAESRYFSFVGYDEDGTEWRTERVSVPLSFIGHQKTGRAVVGHAYDVAASKAFPTPSTKIAQRFRAVCPGEFFLPFWEADNVDGEPCQLKKLDLITGTCILRRFENRVEIEAVLPDSVDVESKAERLLQALSIAYGRYLHAAALWTQSADTHSLRIQPRSMISEQQMLPGPIDFNWSDADACAEYLIGSVLEAEASIVKGFFGHWYRLAHSWNTNWEIMALVAGVAVEGVVKTLFGHLVVPDEESAKRLVAAIPDVEALEIDPQVKLRLVNWMKKRNEPSIQDAVRALEAQNVITRGLVEQWRFLRNRAAHGVELLAEGRELQQVADAVHSSLEMFYRLLFKSISYQGAMAAYGTNGWPRLELGVVSPAAAQPIEPATPDEEQ